MAALCVVKQGGGSVVDFGRGKKLPAGELLTLPCDILIPAARPDTIHAGNVNAIQARLVLPGANLPATAEAEQTLHRRGVVMVPDFIANAGGVICAAVELRHGTEGAAFEQILQKIRHNTEDCTGCCSGIIWPSRTTPQGSRLGKPEMLTGVCLRV